MERAQFDALETEVRRITRPNPKLLTYYLLLALTALFGFPFVFVPLYFRYHTLFYRFDSAGLSMGYGILFRREMHLTYARMQDIHLSQNLLERWLGLGTVTVQTAGAGAGGDLRIVGVTQFEPIRDYLYARMRGARAEASGALDGSEPSTSDPNLLLAEIRDQLRGAAQALASRGGSR